MTVRLLNSSPAHDGFSLRRPTLMIQSTSSPRSTTTAGRTVECGNDLGTASPRLVPRRALIPPRRVRSPRDLGADAHAYTESSASTSDLGDRRHGPRMCRRERGMPDDARSDADECAAQRRFDLDREWGNFETPSPLPETSSTTPPRIYEDARAPLGGASAAGGCCQNGRREASFENLDVDLNDVDIGPKSPVTKIRPARCSMHRQLSSDGAAAAAAARQHLFPREVNICAVLTPSPRLEFDA
ncbi:hypothetical protein EV121DRAFT_274915 [Schizophyllum commune]